jgi:hypothetical protein
MRPPPFQGRVFDRRFGKPSHTPAFGLQQRTTIRRARAVPNCAVTKSLGALRRCLAFEVVDRIGDAEHLAKPAAFW